MFVLLLAYIGLRWGEAYAEDNGKLYLDTPKNHERRSVPPPQFLAEELKPHVQGRGDEQLLSRPRRANRCVSATSASGSLRRRS